MSNEIKKNSITVKILQNKFNLLLNVALFSGNVATSTPSTRRGIWYFILVYYSNIKLLI